VYAIKYEVFETERPSFFICNWNVNQHTQLELNMYNDK